MSNEGDLADDSGSRFWEDEDEEEEEENEEEE